MKIFAYISLPALFALLMISAAFCPEGGAADESPCRPTAENIEGPYYIPGAPFRENLVPEGASGDRLEVSGAVFAGDCVTPLEGAVIEVWQTDAAGRYDFSDAFLLRGRVRADELGRYRFETLLPGKYRSGSTYRPAHIHLRVSHREGRTLVTQLYFEKDPDLLADPFVLSSLVVPLKENSREGRKRFATTFDIVLEHP